MFAAVPPTFHGAFVDLTAIICQALPNPVFVVFAGQSEMVGYGMTPAGAALAGWKPDPLTMIWDNAHGGGWVTYQPGVNATGGVGVWGPEMKFVLDFRADHPATPLFLVKTNAGETSLEQNVNANADWNPLSHGEMFDKAEARIEAASATLGKHPDMVALFQGTTDAFSQTAASHYDQNFDAFVDAIRERWMHDENGYVVWARIGQTAPYSQLVRDAQLDVDLRTDNTDSFDSDPLPKQDGIHPTADGQLQSGDHYYTLFEGHFGI